MSFPIRISLVAAVVISWVCPAAGQKASWEAETEAGHQAYLQGHYAEAQNYFLAAIKSAQQEGDDDARNVTARNNLAALYMREGRYSDAEQLYLQALSIRKNVSGTEDIESATILGNLGALYF